MSYTVFPINLPQNFNITIAGCGGTGGFVAEGLCRLLIGSDIPILLVDPDHVEPHNLLRQNFYDGDEGKFKSQVLAERLSRQFDRPIAYSVYPFMRDLSRDGFRGSDGLHQMAIRGLIVGCVDNADARREIAESTQRGNWWLDAGNGFSSGQVLLGDSSRLEYLGAPFVASSGSVLHLPMPTWQQPSLLIPPTVTTPVAADCAEAVAAEDQSPVINQAMATLVLEFIYRLLNKKLTWMGAYLDLEAGTLQTVPAEPEVVARMCGVKVDTLIEKEAKNSTRRRNL